MKSGIYILSLVLLSVIFFSSCSDKTYAKELKAEQALIDAFIKRQKINVIHVLPADTVVWGENDYYLSKNGLYIHMVDLGDLDSKKVIANDEIVPRYIQYTLEEEADTISKWTTVDVANPISFNYQDYTQSCEAFHEAVKIMKRNESFAKLIIPSKICFENFWDPATPMGFDLKIQITN